MSQRSVGYGLALVALAVMIAPPARGAAGTSDVVIPTAFESGHIYATPTLANGRSMRLMLDTGGGTAPTLWISNSQAAQLGISVDHQCKVDGQTYNAASPTFEVSSRLPELSTLCRGVVVIPDEAAQGTSGQVVPSYFRGGVWTFDYPGRQVVIRRGRWRPSKDAHGISLGFKKLPDRHHAGWPRITINVDGESLNMLLDTGATAKPTPESLQVAPRDLTDGFTVGSYITQSTLQKWRTKHPDWLVIENGDALLPTFSHMIRVPELEVAGWSLGPVWFIERPDEAFHSMMASLMDEPPEGAIGGNVLEHFRLTIDYQRSEGWFQCESECSSANAAQSGKPQRR